MPLLKRSLLVVAAVCFAAGSLAQAQDKKAKKAAGQEEPPAPVATHTGGAMQHRMPTLDYNYYHPNLSAGAATGQIPAQLYLCPRPVPAYVGHVWISYPPFQPHEWLWEHTRGYVRYHPRGGWTMTTIRWAHENR